MKIMPASIFYIDFLRFIAVIAVIAIHVLGPFRFLYGEIPDSDWLAAMGVNSLSRWAVPVFMMISGALLLSTQRPFQCDHYLHKRLAKVMLPFIAWTVIYAFVSGFMVNEVFTGQWDSETTIKALKEAVNEPVWYHLWFFYDFIPLYFVIPFLMPILKKASPDHIKLALFTWMFLLLMHWFNVASFLQQNLILYSGYLVLGWYLFNRDNRPQLKGWIVAGTLMLLMNFFGSWQLAFEKGQYSSFYMGYKTFNTAVIGAMLFVLAQTYADNIQGQLRYFISMVSTYSLGIYLIHPLLLISVRELNNGFYAVFGSNWIAIPIITLFTLIFALFFTMLLVQVPIIKRLVP